jgi:hypothetical protein
MTNHERPVPTQPLPDTSEATKRARLERFVGPAHEHDRELAEDWRHRSPAAHAQAGAELSDMAARMALQTGLHKTDEMVPPLSSLIGQRGGRE